ncbi:DUF885 family protein [Lysobacter ciconiae]|uniref:DUF885 family protein n=1 Tax=Novilysobacter ciconiae TaxID=2781022 RepID=A0A7S6UEH1_9GAMM|nr:DUF885 family protein [Lysobacter ciconiae]QOW18771.1 DUF885 family protein [Lysobacter ciconiae]
MRPSTPATLLALALAAAMAGCSPNTATGSAETDSIAGIQSVSDKPEHLDRLYALYWEETLKRNPLAATYQGDNRYNDQLPNFLSREYRDTSRAFTTEWLEKIESLGPDGLEGQDLLSWQIFVRDARDELASQRFPAWMQPVNQFYNIASTFVQLGSGTGAQPFKTVQDYDNWRERASNVPVLFNQAIANMGEGIEAGVVQPRALMEKVLPQLDALIREDPRQTLFWKPVADMPESFSDADRKRIEDEYATLIATVLMPAYQHLRDYIANDYLPHTRASAGMADLPNGQDWYAFRVHQSTTTDLSPAQIHQIGLDEVARIHERMQEVMDQVGFKGTLQEFFVFMQTDPRFEFASEDELLAFYRGLEAKVNAKVPELFSLVPRSPFEIRPVEAFRAQSAAGGSYMTPSEDGSRPGIFYVNTYDLPTRKTWDAEDLFLHEAIPGHHFQLALQQELTGLPAFRRFGGQTAYIEGWGLYAESLGRELGVYEDPYDYFGYLQNELWRAIRLVVDTGLHSKGWTRDQVIDYMLENSAESRTQAVAEAERYMAIPGQALAYKIGELKIRELRRRAEQALGDKFDIRQFHAEVLKDGSVPLDVLEDKIDRWIAASQ